MRLLFFFIFSRRRDIPFVHGTPSDLKEKQASQPQDPSPNGQTDQARGLRMPRSSSKCAGKEASDSFLTVVADDTPDPLEKDPGRSFANESIMSPLRWCSIKDLRDMLQEGNRAAPLIVWIGVLALCPWKQWCVPFVVLV